MTHAAKLAREETITEALRAANDAIGSEEPTPQAFRIFAALKSLRSGEPVRIASGGIDYLKLAQEAARRAWRDNGEAGVAGVSTPLGRLACSTWRTHWTGERGKRDVWTSLYYLNDEPITIAAIKAAGLAQRPTTRNRTPK